MLAIASRLSRPAGLRGLEPLKPLIQTAIAAALELGPERALTGPVVRGNVGTVQAHLKALSARDRTLADLYRAGGRAVLQSFQRRGGRKRTNARAMERLLRGRR